MSKAIIEKYMLKALEKSNVDLKAALNNKLENWKYKENDFLLFKAQTETIHWLLDCIERIDNSIISDEDKKIFSAFKFLNNALKHNNSLAYINIAKGYVTFPLTFPIPNNIVYQWADLSYLKDIKYISQQNNYKEYLEGKSIIETIQKAIVRIKFYSKPIN